MNTRDKILNHLETNIPTSAPQFAKLLGCQKSHINLLLRDLIADGQIEIERISKSVKYYRLASLHHERTEAVLRYLDEQETGMAVEISTATGIDKRLVTKMLSTFMKTVSYIVTGATRTHGYTARSRSIRLAALTS
ncbi:hypothetical protein ORA46_000229 [Enterobacter asburiae]|nr:hypothetical protein [Enterobacter asburiae]